MKLKEIANRSWQNNLNSQLLFPMSKNELSSSTFKSLWMRSLQNTIKKITTGQTFSTEEAHGPCIVVICFFSSQPGNPSVFLINNLL